MSMDHVLSAALAQPDSPFIPGTNIQFAWDSVSLTSILSCPRRYQYQIIDGLVPRNPGYAIALVFGILFHKGVEYYHRARAEWKDKPVEGGSDRIDHMEAVFLAVKKILADPATATLPLDDHIEELAESHDPDEDDGIHLRNSKIRTRYYLIRAIVWYLEHYKDDPCDTIILASGEPAVELSFRVPLPIALAGYDLILCGHIDRGVVFNERTYSADYKTTKSLTRQFFDMFDLSHQMTGYTSAGKIIFNQPVAGAMIDGVALQVGQVKFGRAFTTRTPGQINEYMELLGYVADKAVLHAETNSYPMNTASCYFCEFKNICRQPPEYRERYIGQNYHKARGWNPLENR